MSSKLPKLKAGRNNICINSGRKRSIYPRLKLRKLKAVPEHPRLLKAANLGVRILFLPMEQPTVHEGYHAQKLEAMGIKSERSELNRQIKTDNKLLSELKHQVQKLIKAVKENIPYIAAALERAR